MEQAHHFIRRILVTGADGFVGTAVCRELTQRGYCVRRAQRKYRRLASESERIYRYEGTKLEPNGHSEVQRTASEAFELEAVVVGEIGSNTDWVSALSGIDAVVHLAARVHVMEVSAANRLEDFREVNVYGTRRLAEAATQAGVKRLVFLSSVKVNGETTDRVPNDTKERAKWGKPFKEVDPPQPEDPYGISKWEAEQVLRDIEKRAEIEVVIIRPPLIYGPGVKANFLNLIKLIERGMLLPFGGIRNRRSLLSLTNLVDLISYSLQHPAAAGETFLASDSDDVSTPELARRIAVALGKPIRLLPVPEWMLKLGGRITGRSEQVKRLCGSLQVDSSKVRQALCWTPPCTMAEELARVAAWRAGCLNTQL